MSLLRVFLNSISNSNLDALESLALPSKESALLKFLIDNRTSSDVESRLHKQLNISASHSHKMQSVLLRKCYEQLIPGGTIDLLSFLSTNSNLILHFRKEMHRQRRDFLPTRTSDEKISYYRSLLRICTKVPLLCFDSGLLASLKRSYLNSVSHEQRTDAEIYCRATELRGRIFVLSGKAELNKEIQRKILERQLRKLESDASKRSSDYASFYSALSWFDYYFAIESAQQSEFLRKAQELSVRLAAGIDEQENQYVHIRYIVSLFQTHNQFRTAFDEFKKLFEAYPSLRIDYYVASKFIQTAIILEEFQAAQEILLFAFSKEKQPHSQSGSVIATLNYAKYYISVGDYSNARHSISVGLQLISKKLYIQYEIEFRNLETALFALVGDREMTLQLVHRNLKYLQRKGFIRANSDFHEFYTVIRVCVTTGQNFVLSDDVESILKKWSTGVYNVYGVVLKRVVEKYTTGS